MFLHVVDGAGILHAQADGYPINGRPGERLLDERLIVLPPNLPAGDYRLLVGLYDWSDGTLDRFCLWLTADWLIADRCFPPTKKPGPRGPGF